MRTETDPLGTLEIPESALYGIHSLRAKQNFPYHTPFHIEWYKAIGTVKLAYYKTYKNFVQQVRYKYQDKSPIKLMDDVVIENLIKAARKLSMGDYYSDFIVPAIQGGAGTSINMNINEILANVALQNVGSEPGNYAYINPIEHANIYQSTNDVIPSALKVAAMQLLVELEASINVLRNEIEQLEKQHRYTLRIGYTQYQEAVPTSFGRLLSTYNEALSRDWWRVSKCFERLKQLNIGGSAIGTGITVPRFFIMETIKTLRDITNLPVARSENMSDATSNLDCFVEVHAILKAHAVNLEKMTADIRLLSSDIIENKEIHIPAKQTGSSIMPGKVNPVIIEFIISAAHKTYSNDMLISNLSGQGSLELNPYLPIIGNALLESIKLLTACNKTLNDNLFNELTINQAIANEKLFRSTSITTALLPYIGYKKSEELAYYMKQNKCSVFEANEVLQIVDSNKLQSILQAENLLKEGFNLSEIVE
ncbi:MAG: lyase family protein [Bacteroidales bacterium]